MGSEMDDIVLSSPTSLFSHNNKNKPERKNLIVVYDGGDHSELVMKTTSWFEHSGLFKVSVLAVTDKNTLLKQEDHISNMTTQGTRHDEEHKNMEKGLENEDFLANIGVEFDRVILTEESQRNASESARLILAAVNASQPDIVVTGASIGKFNVFSNLHYSSLIKQLSCPVVIARDFAFPGVNKIKTAWMRIAGK